MSLNILKKQVKYCLLNEFKEEDIKLLKNKTQRKKTFVKRDKEKIQQENLRFFELNDKHKTISKNIMKKIKSNK
jgi:uncharacterized protein with GYD domain